MQKPHLVALNKQLALIKFWRSDVGQRFGQYYEMSLRSQDQTPTSEYHGKTLSNWLGDWLDRSETYWAADEMIKLVDYAAKSYPDEALLPTDLPTQTGFVLMEKSRYFVDRHNTKLGWRAFTWHVTSEQRQNIVGPVTVDGVEVCFYTDPHDMGDEQMAALPEKAKAQYPLSLVHRAFWPFDYNIENLMENMPDEDYDALPPQAVTDVVFMHRFLKTFWRLIQQRIMHIDHHKADKNTIKRATYSGFLGEMDDIKVITLRRYHIPQPDLPDEDDADKRVVEWSHRWIVDGFWRNQYYPSIKGHRAIYISPFIKGPADRPLIIKDKIFKWTR